MMEQACWRAHTRIRGSIAAISLLEYGEFIVLAHERAKETLLRAASFSERAEAARSAIALGMPLAEIEEFLDHLDAIKKPGEAPVSLSSPTAQSVAQATGAVGPRVESRLTGTGWAAIYVALAASLLVATTVGSIRLYRIWMARSDSQPDYVAELCGSADAQWLMEGMPEADGRLPAGRRLVLASGLAEIVFASGSQVILEGPAEFQPLSPTEGLLSQGLLSARVPPAARGFVVRAPNATVVDLGTEFGIAVEHGGLSDVEVFAGRVEVGLNADADAEPTGTKQVLLAGEAIQVWLPAASGRPLMETTAAGLMRFVRSLPSATKPPTEAAQADAPATVAERFGVPEAAEELVGPLYQPKGRLVYLDLASHANEDLSKSKGTVAGNDLMELGSGEQTLAGVRFHIGGSTIQLGSKRLPEGPSQVQSIPVRRRVATLYLLHAAQYGDARFGVADGTLIGHYQIRYADGNEATIPIVCGEDVRDWWSYDPKNLATRGQVAWVGRNAATKQAKFYLRLYLSVWENPRPETPIASLDYVSAMTAAAPFCAAITVEIPLPVQARPVPPSA